MSIASHIRRAQKALAKVDAYDPNTFTYEAEAERELEKALALSQGRSVSAPLEVNVRCPECGATMLRRGEIVVCQAPCPLREVEFWRPRVQLFEMEEHPIEDAIL